MSYDIIGDIHGHADALKKLLIELGYEIHNGAWKHPNRTAVFVGDFIDRGSQQLETVEIVKSMVEAGSALAIMGNHELNALAWYYKDSNGDYLRSHEKISNFNQHKQFLKEIGANKDLHEDILKWFLTLPLWLDLPELRAVHACWDQPSIDFLKDKLDSNHKLTKMQLESATKKPSTHATGMTMFSAIETILKGIEVPLPEGISFFDKDNHERYEVRVKWWDTNAKTYREIAVVGESVRNKIPDIPIKLNISPYEGKPVFFGHYWMIGEPKTLTDNIACVDYSVANNGKLTAYRWNGESVLENKNFCQHRKSHQT